MDGMDSPSIDAVHSDHHVHFVHGRHLMKILYEDEWLIFVDKPPGLVVQRAYDETEPVLYEEVRDAMAAKGEDAFLVQRLDRGTSGVIFFTKRSEINRTITRGFERKAIHKIYVALCEGRITTPQTIDAPIARIGAIKFGVREEGRRAVTNVVPLAWNDRRSFVGLELLSGRTHQIRVHLAAIGHPLVGDWLYGERNAERPMLHALHCAMAHPGDQTPLAVTAPYPADLASETLAANLLTPGEEEAIARIAGA